MRPPAPDVRVAWLPSAGIPRDRDGDPEWTRHVFDRTRACTILVQADIGESLREETAFEFVFRCTRTGAERRWGVVDMRGEK